MLIEITGNGVTHKTDTLAIGTLIELDESSANSLIDAELAKQAIAKKEAQGIDIKAALDSKYTKDQLIEILKAEGIAYEEKDKKGILIDLLIANEKAEELLKDV